MQQRMTAIEQPIEITATPLRHQPERISSVAATARTASIDCGPTSPMIRDRADWEMPDRRRHPTVAELRR